mmetsp:Transcript_7353/g.6697  ORF Transcript_7353/g.6697 Transcript_7353/m.6697 type:complete len:261 (-) Transcript_7353:1169-1951(-)
MLPRKEENKRGGPIINCPEDITDQELYRRRFIDGLNPSRAFHLFFPDDFYDLMLDQTSRYIRQQVDKKFPHTDKRADRLLNLRDVKNYMALYLWMCLIRVPTLKQRWTDNPLFYTHFSKVMSYKRFNLINQCIHLANNQSADRGDPLFKIRPVLDVLEKKFKDNYEMSENVHFDEGMIKFKGPLYFNQTTGGKTLKWGIKIFLLCESRNGYCYNFKIFTGKREHITNYNKPEQTFQYMRELKQKRKLAQQMMKEEIERKR